MAQSMEAMLKEYQQKVENSVKVVNDLLKVNGITSTKSGYMADNIYIMDFSKSDFAKAKTFVVDSCTEGLSRINYYDKNNRIALMF